VEVCEDDRTDTDASPSFAVNSPAPTAFVATDYDAPTHSMLCKMIVMAAEMRLVCLRLMHQKGCL
jgi:hypothetical protein